MLSLGLGLSKKFSLAFLTLIYSASFVKKNYLGHDSYGVRGVPNDFYARLETPHSKTLTRHADALGQALGFSGLSGNV